MSTLSTFRTLVYGRIKDEKKILGDYSKEPDIYDKFINEAIKEYSYKNPDRKLYSHTATSSETTVYDLPSDWEEDFSVIDNIEYPVSKFPPEIIPNKNYEVTRTDEGLRLRFLEYEYPTSGNEFWVRYTVRHSVTTTTSTIPGAHEESVANLAVALGCEAIANWYAHSTDSTLSADVINYQSKAAEFNSRADKYRKLCSDIIPPDTTGLVGDWDFRHFDDRDSLTHDKDYV